MSVVSVVFVHLLCKELNLGKESFNYVKKIIEKSVGHSALCSAILRSINCIKTHDNISAIYKGHNLQPQLMLVLLY